MKNKLTNINLEIILKCSTIAETAIYPVLESMNQHKDRSNVDLPMTRCTQLREVDENKIEISPRISLKDITADFIQKSIVNIENLGFKSEFKIGFKINRKNKIISFFRL